MSGSGCGLYLVVVEIRMGVVKSPTMLHPHVDVNSLMFARGARFSQLEVQERYREDCQRVFDLQNK